MKVRRKPLEKEAEIYKKGMEDGIVAFCIGAHREVFFDDETSMNQSPMRGKVKSWQPCMLVDNHPVAIEEGDVIIDGIPWRKKKFHEEWDVVEEKRGPGRPPKDG